MTTTVTSRTAQGLPPRVADPAVLRRVANLLVSNSTTVPVVVGDRSAARPRHGKVVASGGSREGTTNYPLSRTGEARQLGLFDSDTTEA
jgi:hypothetical protein